MLTLDQKAAVYGALKKSFTVGSTAFAPNVIYENQFVSVRPSYPFITLSYISTTGFITEFDSNGWGSTVLSVNVYAEDSDGRPSGEFLNGDKITSDIMRQLINDINNNFNSDVTTLSNDVRLNARIYNVRDLTGVFTTESHVSRLQVDVELIYKVS